MADAFDPRLLFDPPLASLDEYIASGGGVGLGRAVTLDAAGVIALIDTAGLRGRGGAGFPAARKWRSVVGDGVGTRYAVANAAEGEPGTFKDRALIRANPYAVVEGLAIAAHTVGAARSFIALKTSFATEIQLLQRALDEMGAAGWLDPSTVTIVAGPEEYLFGEEKALLEVIEGNEPLPRWLPPYLHGLFVAAPQLGWQAHERAPGRGTAKTNSESDDPSAGDPTRGGANPTLVNNAETLAHVAWILGHGADEFRKLGTAESAGSLLCTVVGDVAKPGVFEVPMGTPLREVLERAGGALPGRTVKAIFPGVANAVLTAGQLDVVLSYESLGDVGSGLGAGGFIVYDDSACMVEVAAMLSRFLYVESCGQCPPCKIGSGDITAALDRIRTGTGQDSDLGLIEERLRIVTDGNRCYLPVQERIVVSSILRSFPDDFAAHLEGGCPSRRGHLQTPKIADIADATVTYDAHQDLKRPDWTYEP